MDRWSEEFINNLHVEKLKLQTTWEIFMQNETINRKTVLLCGWFINQWRANTDFFFLHQQLWSVPWHMFVACFIDFISLLLQDIYEVSLTSWNSLELPSTSYIGKGL